MQFHFLCFYKFKALLKGLHFLSQPMLCQSSAALEAVSSVETWSFKQPASKAACLCGKLSLTLGIAKSASMLAWYLRKNTSRCWEGFDLVFTCICMHVKDNVHAVLVMCQHIPLCV